MVDHKCQYAELIGKSPEWQTDESGLTVCKYCHEPKYNPVAKAPAKASTLSAGAEKITPRKVAK